MFGKPRILSCFLWLCLCVLTYLVGHMTSRMDRLFGSKTRVTLLSKLSDEPRQNLPPPPAIQRTKHNLQNALRRRKKPSYPKHSNRREKRQNHPNLNKQKYLILHRTREPDHQNCRLRRSAEMTAYGIRRKCYMH